MKKLIWLIHGGDGSEWIWHYWRIHYCAYWSPEFKDVQPVFLTENKMVPHTWTDVDRFKSGPVPFSDGLINLLEKYDTEYVLYMIDDMWPVAPLSEKKMLSACEEMKKHCIPILKPWNNTPQVTDCIKQGNRMENGWYIYDDTLGYAASLQPAIWQKDFFLDILRRNENPWETEVKGSSRVAEKKVVHCIYPKKDLYPYAETIRHGKIRKGMGKYFDQRYIGNLSKKSQWKNK